MTTAKGTRPDINRISWIRHPARHSRRSFDWLLTTNFKDLPNSARRTRHALAIFTYRAKTLQQRRFTQEITISRPNSFPHTSFSSDPKICGHYHRVVDSFLQSNQSQSLSLSPNLFDFLSQHLSCLGPRDLFVTLLTSESLSINFSTDLFATFLNGISTLNSDFAITALRIVLKRSHDPIFDVLRSSEITDKLFDHCLPSPSYPALVGAIL
jgi:hypothetical protein